MHNDKLTELSDIQKQLQKTFSAIKQCRLEIQEIETVAGQCIKTIANLSEQYQSCCAVRVMALPSSVNFAEVKEKLLFKISSEINENVNKLQAQVSSYEVFSKRMSKQYEQCISKYNKCCCAQELNQLIARSPLCPSVTDMLEWVEVSERMIRESYLCKKFVVDTFTPDQPGICDSLESSWREGDKDLCNQLDEYLALTNNFMELKIS